MKTWNVTVTETLTKTVPIEADDSTAAEGIARAMYDNHEIVLLPENICDTEITAEEESICPLCGTEVEYEGDNDIDDDGGSFPWKCPGCGARGKEGYSRRFSGHFDVTAD